VNEAGQKVLYAIVCGAPPARDVGKLVDLAEAAGWDVCVIASPDGRRFIDVEALTAKTGHTVRSAYKAPAASDELPPADAMIVAPATCNTIAKWAAGISDTLPLGLVVEAVGKGLPVVAMPFSNRRPSSASQRSQRLSTSSHAGECTSSSATMSTDRTNPALVTTSSRSSRGTSRLRRRNRKSSSPSGFAPNPRDLLFGVNADTRDSAVAARPIPTGRHAAPYEPVRGGWCCSGASPDD
jgi:Flavoprotein